MTVVLSATAFSIEWLFGATAPIPFDTVFGAMVGVHALIGIGEGLLSALVVGAVMAARPDLVAGARDLSAEEIGDRRPVGARAFAIGGVLVAIVFAVVVSQFAFDDPDGLERVAQDHGFIDRAQDHAVAGSPFADYATRGIGNAQLSLAVAGLAGVVVTLLVAYGLTTATRRVPPRRSLHTTSSS